MAAKPVLLSIVELGGYPDFSALFKRLGFDVVSTDSVRKAIKLIRKHQPSVIIAEFNFQSDFRDRTSSLETILSSVQGVAESKVIVFYEKEMKHQYDRFLAHFSVYASMPFPVDEALLENTLEQSM